MAPRSWYKQRFMHFIDECELEIQAGDGGDGAVAFRREKFLPFGGPSGGDGGRGGHVIFVADEGVGTLQDLAHLTHIRAERGTNGGGKDKYGRAGNDREVRVPVGTIINDADTREVLCELISHGQREVMAEGGKGGRGNRHFTTSVDRAPRRAERGQPGVRRSLRLELKVMADVGLLGFPNVGKSTFIRAVSRARPKVANYPFTTLQPHLGVVTIGDYKAGLGKSFVVADIPGLIPGASDGAGLGIRFLRHVERTRVLLHLITLSADPERSPLEDYRVLREELERFNPELLRRPEIVALTKCDLPDVREAYEELRAQFAAMDRDLLLVSAATSEGVRELLHELAQALFI